MDDFKNDIKEIQKSVKQIEITLAKQHVSIDEHIRRTNLLEQKLEPVEKHVHMVNGALKFLGIIALVVGIFASIFKLLS